MNFKKPNYWDRQIGLISIVLLPITLIVLIVNFLKKKLIKPEKFNIPIICVGNIYIGGTGKTPTSMLLASKLSKLERKPAIIRKYYKSHLDEYNLIKNNAEILITNKSRIEALKKAETNFDIAILDDGLQDYKIKKDISIVCFNHGQLIGNGLVLPSGPLRENLSALKDTDIIIINGPRNKNFENKILNINKKLEIFYSLYKPINLDQFENKKLFAIAGIGNPENFFELIEQNNLKIEKKLTFPDHYKFSKPEIQEIVEEAKINNYQIIMTEKDYFKINHYNLDKINYLKVALEIDGIDKLVNRINKI
jgi:tetraacyldisaccharide 4'-kinase